MYDLWSGTTGFQSLPSHKRRLADLRRPFPVSILQTWGVIGPSWSLRVAEEPAGRKYHWHVQTRVQQVRPDQDAEMCSVSCLFELPVSDPEGSEQRASSLWVRTPKWMTEHLTFCMSFPCCWWFPSLRVHSSNSPKASVIHFAQHPVSRFSPRHSVWRWAKDGQCGDELIWIIPRDGSCRIDVTINSRFKNDGWTINRSASHLWHYQSDIKSRISMRRNVQPGRQRRCDGWFFYLFIFLLHHLSSNKPAPERKEETPTCDVHEGEKINIYCVTHGVPTCSMCKIFGAHKDCEVAAISNIYQTKKVTTWTMSSIGLSLFLYRKHITRADLTPRCGLPLRRPLSLPLLQTELSDGISMMVSSNDRMQGIISQLEETCRAIEVSVLGRPLAHTASARLSHAGASEEGK